jgi:hypothetical protein
MTTTADSTIDLPHILDIEASGFGLGSYPIEVGIVMGDGRSWCSLVKPEPAWQHWDPNAASLHGICRDQLETSGRTAKEVAAHLNQWLKGMVIYTDAWAHDYTWLNKIFEAASVSPQFKLENLRALLTDDEAQRWHDIKLGVAKNLALTRHRASSDARILQMTIQALRHPERAAA